MDVELKQKLNILFDLRNKTKINRTKLNSLIDEIKSKITRIENGVIEYIPVRFTIKDQGITTIYCTLEQLYDFEDWLICNQSALETWKYEKFIFDDVKENLYKEIFRNSIKFIDWPAFMEIDGKLQQGKWFVDMKKPIVKSCDNPYIRR